MNQDTTPTAEIIQQAARLSSLRNYPFHTEGQLELARSLNIASGGNTRFAERIISAICDEDAPCPQPRGIKLKAHKILRPGDSGSIGQVDCQHCNGSGFVSTGRLKTVQDVRGNPVVVEYAYAARCRCRGGFSDAADAPTPRKTKPARPVAPDWHDRA